MDSNRHCFHVRASVRIYRWLLRAYPRDYRREWAEPMQRLFRDCAADAFSRAGHFGLAALWRRTLWDYVTSLAREYRRRKRPPVRAPGVWNVDPMTNFTPRAQQALALARKEAVRLGHESVGTEHILLGILGQGENMAVGVLKRLGVEPDSLRSTIETRVGPVAKENPGSSIPFTRPVKRMLAIAGREARQLGHSYLGCEHMLIALTLVDEGPSAVALREFGVNADRCRAELQGDAFHKLLALEWIRGQMPKRAPPGSTVFEGVGTCVRQNSTENIYGHVALSLRLTLMAIRDFPPAPAPRVTFGVTEENFPNDQWAVVQQAIQGWCRENPAAFGKWFVAVHISGGSWQAGATPAFGEAAILALRDAIGKAAAAGMLPSP